MDEKIELVVEVRQGKRVTDAARAHGVSRKTAHKWLRVYRESRCLAALEERSRRPHRSPGRLEAGIEARVLALRKDTGWGGRKISKVLQRDEALMVSPATVDRVIERHGLRMGEPRTHAAPLRFERAEPNELWQIDHKAPVTLRDGLRRLPLTILDDHSRFAIALACQRDTSHQETERTLHAAFDRYGLPEAMLMDHGVPWWSATSGYGLTRFSVLLIEQGITVTYGRVGHPQTQGKVERFHRALDRRLGQRGRLADEAALATELAQFRHEYNQVRPHEALGMDVPAARYTPSRRRYAPRPNAWEYPRGADVRRLNSAGLLELGARRYFVGLSLAGKLVWCRRFGSRALITYRHMTIREIDLDTGVTWPLVKPWYSPEM